MLTIAEWVSLNFTLSMSRLQLVEYPSEEYASTILWVLHVLFHFFISLMASLSSGPDIQCGGYVRVGPSHAGSVCTACFQGGHQGHQLEGEHTAHLQLLMMMGIILYLQEILGTLRVLAVIGFIVYFFVGGTDFEEACCS